MGKDLNRHFFKEGIRMASRHMKRSSTLLIIRDMKIKTSMRCHLTPVRMATINKQVLVRMWRKWNPSSLHVGMHTGAATVESSREFPQKIKNGTVF